MKIYSDNDEANRLREEMEKWDKQYSEKKAKYDEESERYYNAKEEVYRAVKSELMEHLKRFNLIEFDIRVSSGNLQESGEPSIEVIVSANDDRSGNQAALRWEYRAGIKWGGELVVETNSWSGMNGVGADNIAELKQAVEAMEYLNTVDWEKIVRKTPLPKAEDYITEEGPDRRSRPNFEFQIKSAELSDYIGSGIPLKGLGIEKLGYSYRAEVWYLLHRETPKKFVVSSLSAHNVNIMVERGADVKDIIENMAKWKDTVWKADLVASLEYPFVTLEG